MRSGETLYYLEMRTPADVVPPLPGRPPLELVEVRDIEIVRRLTVGIGRPYDWPSVHWDEHQWREYEQRTDLGHWAAVLAGVEVGLVSFSAREGEVELDTFGLLPEFIGRGLGSAFLTMALGLAWSEVGNTTRVWLHTSSEDHPHALENYLRRGFRLYNTVVTSSG